MCLVNSCEEFAPACQIVHDFVKFNVIIGVISRRTHVKLVHIGWLLTVVCVRDTVIE